MTDKELKKLSRLELLEILLEESKENERLREMLNKNEKENSHGYSEGALTQLTEQLNGALSEVNRLADDLRYMRRDNITVENIAAAPSKELNADRQSYPTPPERSAPQVHTQTPVMDENTKKAIISDRKLYWRLMHFYSKNEMALAFLPPDIQEDVRTRLRGIMNAAK